MGYTKYSPNKSLLEHQINYSSITGSFTSIYKISLCSHFKFRNFVKELTSYKNPDNPSF